MKTYIWAENDDWDSPFEYDFMAVIAESLDDARKLAIEELQKLCDKNYTVDDFDMKCKIINTTVPIILEPNTALLIYHSNP